MAEKNKDNSKAKTIYVVTSGEYSDYRIEGVFTDKDKAEAFADRNPKYEIEEYPANPDFDKPNGKTWYRVAIYVGESMEVKNAAVFNAILPESCIDAVQFNSCKQSNTNDIRYFDFYVAAPGVKKAKAIALERFHALLAVEQTHFPMLRWVNGDSSVGRIQSGLVFGYFDYKAYVSTHDRLDILLWRMGAYLPIKLTDEERKSVESETLTDDDLVDMFKKHGLELAVTDKIPM